MKAERSSILGSKKKKGNVMLDGGLFLIIMFIFIVITISVYPLFVDIKDDIQDDDDYSNLTKTLTEDKVQEYPPLFDNLFMVILVVMWALVMIASFNIDAHPVFFIFTAIITVFLIIAAGMLANYYIEFAADEEYAQYIHLFPMMNYIGSHFAHAMAAIVISITLALFGKARFS